MVKVKKKKSKKTDGKTEKAPKWVLRSWVLSKRPNSSWGDHYLKRKSQFSHPQTEAGSSASCPGWYWVVPDKSFSAKAPHNHVCFSIS